MIRSLVYSAMRPLTKAAFSGDGSGSWLGAVAGGLAGGMLFIAWMAAVGYALNWLVLR